jgi:hypothetical protein
MDSSWRFSVCSAASCPASDELSASLSARSLLSRSAFSAARRCSCAAFGAPWSARAVGPGAAARMAPASWVPGIGGGARPLLAGEGNAAGSKRRAGDAGCAAERQPHLVQLQVALLLVLEILLHLEQLLLHLAVPLLGGLRSGAPRARQAGPTGQRAGARWGPLAGPGAQLSARTHLDLALGIEARALGLRAARARLSDGRAGA